MKKLLIVLIMIGLLIGVGCCDKKEQVRRKRPINSTKTKTYLLVSIGGWLSHEGERKGRYHVTVECKNCREISNIFVLKGVNIEDGLSRWVCRECGVKDTLRRY